MLQKSLVVFDIETITDSDHDEGNGFPKPLFLVLFARDQYSAMKHRPLAPVMKSHN